MYLNHKNNFLRYSALISFLFLFILIPDLTNSKYDRDSFFKNATVIMDPDDRSPVEIIFIGETPSTIHSFINGYKKTYKLEAENDLKISKVFTDKLGLTHHRLIQYYKNIILSGIQYLLHQKNNTIFYAHGHLIHGIDLDITPFISENQALEYALDHINANSYMWQDARNDKFLQNEQNNADATFYPSGELQLSAGNKKPLAENFKLVYRFDIYSKKPLARYYVDVDAKTGEVINLISRFHSADIPASGLSLYNNSVKITADSFSGGYRLCESQRGEGVQTFDMSNDIDFYTAKDFVDSDTNFIDPNVQAGVSAHWGAEIVYDYYMTQHGRNSYDDEGSTLYSYVHYNKDFNNAGWDGSRLIYGDGDNNHFTPFVSLDIVAHEITHAVTQSSADLFYQNEPGALNESLSDIFGTVIEFYEEGLDGDWLIGEDISLKKPALRSMKDPNSLNHPDTYKGNFWFPQAEDPDKENDFGGIHFNCGVLNYWFYLLTEGGDGINDFGYSYSVSGIGIQEATQIIYRNLTTYLMPYSGFSEAKKGSIHSTVDLFGENSPQYQAVLDAWNAVGVSKPYPDPIAVLSLDSLNFLAEVSVSSDTAAISIKNHGLNTLKINNCYTTGTNYNIASEIIYPIELAYEENFVINIAFYPTNEGEIIDTLFISSNEESIPTKIVTLKGMGFKINPAATDALYSVAGPESNGILIRIDQESFESNKIGPTGFESPKGLSICPSEGILYSTIDAADSTILIKIDTKTGHTSTAGVIPLANIRAIAFDINDDLYALQADNGNLYVISPSLENIDLIGNTHIKFPIGLTLNPYTRKLWASSLLNDTLYTIDKHSAKSTAIGNTGLERTAGLTFDTNGKLIALANYYINRITDLFYINPITSKSTSIGPTEFMGVYGIVFNTGVTKGSVPNKCVLYQNYPNPFNSRTTIEYFLDKDSEVLVRIYNIIGEEVRTLINNKQAAGFKTTQWDGRNDEGIGVSTGMYILTFMSEKDMLSNKLLYIK